MPHEAPVYEERYRWTRNSAIALAVCSVALLLGIAPTVSLLMRVVLVPIGGAGAFLCVIVPTSRKVALRVDADGITLGGNPLRYKATTRVVPWHEVEGVFLWRREPGNVRYLGVERAADAPPLTPGGTGKADQIRLYLAPDPPVPALALKVGVTRGMQAFTVDDARLSDAVAHYAPDVSVVDLD